MSDSFTLHTTIRVPALGETVPVTFTVKADRETIAIAELGVQAVSAHRAARRSGDSERCDVEAVDVSATIDARNSAARACIFAMASAQQRRKDGANLLSTLLESRAMSRKAAQYMRK
jgi:hypothetical protein